jgi:hypothetical protein
MKFERQRGAELARLRRRHLYPAEDHALDVHTYRS